MESRSHSDGGHPRSGLPSALWAGSNTTLVPTKEITAKILIEIQIGELVRLSATWPPQFGDKLFLDSGSADAKADRGQGSGKLISQANRIISNPG